MTTRCAVCNHALVRDADSLFNQGASASVVARMLGVSPDSAKRHRHAGHVAPPSVVAPPVVPVPSPTAPTAPIEIDATTAVGQLDILKNALDAMLASALSPTQKIAVIEAQRRVIAERYRVVGPAPSAVIRVQDIEGYAELEAMELEALEPFPAARQVLAKVLRERLAQIRADHEVETTR